MSRKLASLRWYMWLALLVLGQYSCAAQALAQANNKEDRPRLVMDLKGPSAKTHRLNFANDSTRLFSAGGDKVVHVWDIGWNGKAADEDRGTLVDTLRWEVGRANTGLIQAQAVCPNQPHLAVAGNSARNNGDIAIFDIVRREVRAVLPLAPRAPGPATGHTHVINSIAYSPDGAWLISVDAVGEAWLWPIQGPQFGTGILVRKAYSGEVFHSWPATFLSASTFVITALDKVDDFDLWHLTLYSVATGQPQVVAQLPVSHAKAVTDIVRFNDRPLWISADAGGTITRWQGFEQPVPTVLRNGQREATESAIALAAGPDGLLAVSNDAPRGQRSRLELWNVDAGQVLDSIAVPHEIPPSALAISPDGLRLAVANDDVQQIEVFRLRTDDGKPAAKPLSQTQPLVLAGRGRAATRVAAFKQAPKGVRYRFGISTRLDKRIDAVLDLDPFEFQRLPKLEEEANLIADVDFAAGWSAFPATDGDEVVLTRNGAEQARLKLSLGQGRFAGVVRFLGGNEPTMFAFATTQTAQGIYLYSLPGANQPPRLLRYFRDHQGEVTSLTTTPDGKYLVSGSRDQTLKVWSLADLTPAPDFPRSTIWGARFIVGPAGVVAQDVSPAGIAYRREIRDGDIIRSIRVGDGIKIIEVNQPAEIVRHLAERDVFEQVLIRAERAGKPVVGSGTLVVPGWEPLLTLCADVHLDWAAFTPEGYFDASVTEGAELFGWQINRGRNTSPRYLKAETLSKEFERPDVIRRVLQVGNVAEALVQAKLPVPDSFSGQLATKTREVPEVKITAPLVNAPLAESFTVQAEIKVPPGAPDPVVTATLGGRTLGEPTKVTKKEDKIVVEFPATADDKLNKIEVRVREQGPTSILNSVNDSDRVFARGNPLAPAKLPKLHVLALAVNAYDGLNWPTLKYPLKDVQAVLQSLEDKDVAKQFADLQLGHTQGLYNSEVTVRRVKDEIELLHKELNPVGPKDIVVVYLTGHGISYGGDYYFVPPMPSNTQADVEKRGIGWDVFARLSEFHCHVIWMIDTCRSGGGTKAIVRNAKQVATLVVAAAGETEDAYEGEQYTSKADSSTNPGHAAFTASVLNGLEGDADGFASGGASAQKDKVISVSELVEFIKHTVYESTDRAQQPRATPTDLPALIQIRLVRVPTPPMAAK